jgi:hypothetical protein
MSLPEYAVARSTVRRALGELRKRKLIKTLQGLKRGGRHAGAGARRAETAPARTRAAP